MTSAPAKIRSERRRRKSRPRQDLSGIIEHENVGVPVSDAVIQGVARILPAAVESQSSQTNEVSKP